MARTLASVVALCQEYKMLRKEQPPPRRREYPPLRRRVAVVVPTSPRPPPAKTITTNNDASSAIPNDDTVPSLLEAATSSPHSSQNHDHDCKKPSSAATTSTTMDIAAAGSSMKVGTVTISAKVPTTKRRTFKSTARSKKSPVRRAQSRGGVSKNSLTASNNTPASFFSSSCSPQHTYPNHDDVSKCASHHTLNQHISADIVTDGNEDTTSTKKMITESSHDGDISNTASTVVYNIEAFDSSSSSLMTNTTAASDYILRTNNHDTALISSTTNQFQTWEQTRLSIPLKKRKHNMFLVAIKQEEDELSSEHPIYISTSLDDYKPSDTTETHSQAITTTRLDEKDVINQHPDSLLVNTKHNAEMKQPTNLQISTSNKNKRLKRSKVASQQCRRNFEKKKSVVDDSDDDYSFKSLSDTSDDDDDDIPAKNSNSEHEGKMINKKFDSVKSMRHRTILNNTDQQKKTNRIEVGMRVKVYRPCKKQYFAGYVTKIDNDAYFRKPYRPHYLQYDNGDREWRNLEKVEYILLSNTTTMNGNRSDNTVSRNNAKLKSKNKMHNEIATPLKEQHVQKKRVLVSSTSFKRKQQENKASISNISILKKKKKKEDPSKQITSNSDEVSLGSKASLILNKLGIGSRLMVWWPLEKSYYPCTLIRINDCKSRPHFLKYDDGDYEWTNLVDDSFYPLNEVVDDLSDVNTSDFEESDSDFSVMSEY